MISKKLIHDIQTWLNSLYNFNNANDNKNKHIISSIENFQFRFISIRIAIWTCNSNYNLKNLYTVFSINLTTYSEFEKFKINVNNYINEYIKKAINESTYIKNN